MHGRLRRNPQIRGTAGQNFSDTIIAARQRLVGAIRVLGGQGQLVDCVWHIVGLEDTIAEWARRSAWSSGRSANAHQAQGILLAGLDVLAGFYKTRR